MILHTSIVYCNDRVIEDEKIFFGCDACGKTRALIGGVGVFLRYAIPESVVSIR